MAFRFEGGEPVKGAISRLARKELRKAIRTLRDGKVPLTARVHDVRTSIKKVRALTALARPTLGRKAGRADRRLQRAVAPTSALRDAEVLLHTFDGLLPSLPSDAQGASLRRARTALARGVRQRARSFEDDGDRAELEARLRRARREARHWMPRKDGWHGWRAARQGLARGYRRARRAMARAYDQRSGRAFHQWRKAVKTHRHQLQLFHDVWPDQPALIEALDRLGDLLGAEHDLTVLEQTVGTDRAAFPEERDRARMTALIEQRRGDLRAQAAPLGEQLFKERPRAFRRRLREELRARRRDADRKAAGPVAGVSSRSESSRSHLRAV